VIASDFRKSSENSHRDAQERHHRTAGAGAQALARRATGARRATKRGKRRRASP
jgi:hypothetical protein